MTLASPVERGSGGGNWSANAMGHRQAPLLVVTPPPAPGTLHEVYGARCRDSTVSNTSGVANHATSVAGIDILPSRRTA